MSTSTPSRLPLQRPGAMMLLFTGILCGFGLGALGLALISADPTDQIALPSPDPAAMVMATLDPVAPQVFDWPELFGSPAPPPPETEPEPVATGPEPVPPLDARLRGVAMDEEGGWALIETGDAVALVRPGSPLTPDHEVIEILVDRVLISSRDGVTELTFDDSGVTESVATRVRASLPRAIMTGRHEFDEMPMPLPPANYAPGPGFAGPANR